MTSAPYIRTGALNRRAELQAKVETGDDLGGVEVDWVTERSIWVEIRPLSGTQRLESMRRESAVSHRLAMRYQDDVAPGGTLEAKRIKFGAEVFNIEAAWMPEEEPEFVQALATRGVPT